MKMEAELCNLLKEREALKVDGCPYVFPRNGKKIGDIRGPWNRASRASGLGQGYKDKRYQSRCMKEGIEPLSLGPTYHDFRRTGVRNMVRAGIKEEVAMKISGHKTRGVFDRYNIVDDRDLEDAARKMEKQKNERRDYKSDYNLENSPSEELQAILLFLMISGAWDENRTRTGMNPEGF